MNSNGMALPVPMPVKALLTVLVLLAGISPVYGDMPFAAVVAQARISEWWTIPVTFFIEAAVLGLIFGFSWKRAILASVVVNIVTGLAGFVIYPVAAPVVFITGVGNLLETGATLAVTSIIDTALELLILKLSFKARLSPVRNSAFFAANIITAGILFAALLPAEVWNRIPESEVDHLEGYYASEIEYMQQLLKEMPDHCAAGSDPDIYTCDDEWRKKQWDRATRYRFVVLWINAPGYHMNLRYQPAFSERGYNAGYSRGGVEARKGYMKLSADISTPIYQYRIRGARKDSIFAVRAIFKAVEAVEKP